jgi:hypothetical protein
MCGINTMSVTGTVVGVWSNIFGDGFPRNFIASFFCVEVLSGFSPFNFQKFEEKQR